MSDSQTPGAEPDDAGATPPAPRFPLPSEQAAPAAKLRDQLALFRLARDYEALSPNLAAELRFIAARG